MLKVFSGFLDKNAFSPDGLFSKERNLSVLDAGSGTGVLGICAAGALSDLSIGSFRVRSQDRDELARVFTGYNARRNGVSEETLSARTEPLLAGTESWDLILTNIPAKAGLPVLEDFVRRSAGLLKKDGLVFLVAVNTLADFFRSGIKEDAALLSEEAGTEHSVFVYGKPAGAPAHNGDERQTGPVVLDDGFPVNYPFYIRNQNDYEMEDISYKMLTVHGASDFDSPGGAAQAAAHLARKINLKAKLAKNLPEGAILIHDPGQGHFALWLAAYLAGSETSAALLKTNQFRLVLAGRNIVALAAAKSALASAATAIIPCADIYIDRERIKAAEKDYNLIIFIPETVSETDRREAYWQGIRELAAPGSILIAGMSSSEAERFDRKKPSGFSRLGDIKRRGFRAMGYQLK